MVTNFAYAASSGGGIGGGGTGTGGSTGSNSDGGNHVTNSIHNTQTQIIRSNNVIVINHTVTSNRKWYLS
jgi:hypothetical protein